MGLKDRLSSLRENAKYAKWWLKTRIQARQVVSCYDAFDKVYWVPPEQIVAVSNAPQAPRPIAEHGLVRGGDWDLYTIPWERFATWNAFCHRFRDNGRWQETEWYRILLGKIQAGAAPYRCRTWEDLDCHFAKTDQLYHSIKNEGFKLQTDLRPTLSIHKADEVAVHIDRRGHYLFADGRHRLCIAKLLGLERIPVKVARRHVEWVKLRQQILRYAARRNGRVWQPITHPDLADISSAHGHEIFDLIRQHIPPGTGTALEVAANWGYLCHRLEEIGLACTAVEPSPRELHFLQRLHLAQKRRFQIVPKPLSILNGPLHYDVVLTVNRTGRFLKDNLRQYDLTELLAQANAKLIFLDPHHPVADPSADYDPLQFVGAVAARCGMTFRPIGNAFDGKPIYMLEK